MVRKYDIKFSLLTCFSRFSFEIVPRFFFCSSVNILGTQYNLSYMDFVWKDSLTTPILHSCDLSAICLIINLQSFITIFSSCFILSSGAWIGVLPTFPDCSCGIWRRRISWCFHRVRYTFFSDWGELRFRFYHFDVHSAVVCIQINVGHFIFILQ